MPIGRPKGLSLTEEHKKKISLANKGRHINKGKHNSVATEFKKGIIPWNKQVKIIKKCKSCDKEFSIVSSRENSAKYCSKQCLFEGRKLNSRRASIVALYKQGKTYKEIAKLMSLKTGSVCHYVYTSNLRERFGNDVIGFSSKQTLKSRLGKECEICGFKRIIEVAHIKEACKGGKLTTDNCLILCPNHHSLFDRNLLNQDEKLKLFSIKRVKLNLKKRYESEC